jgi:hypothetical protein
MAANRKKVQVDIVTEASGDGAPKAAAGLEKVENAANKANAALSESARQLPVVGAGFEAIANPMGAATLAAAGVAAAFAQKASEAVDLADKLQDLAGQYGVAATAIQRIGNVASDEGSSFEGVAASLNYLIKTSQEAIQKGGEAAKAYESLGIKVEDLAGKNAEEIFMLVADRVATATDRQKAYNDVLTVAGRSAGQLFATLSKGSEEIRRLGEEKGIFDEGDIQRLADAKDALEKINNQLTILSGNLASEALDYFATFARGAGAAKDAVAELAAEFTGIDPGAASQKIGRVTTELGRMASLTTPIGSLFYLLRIGKNTIDDLVPPAEEAQNAVNALAENADDINPDPAADLAAAIDPIKAAADAAAAAVRELAAAGSALESAQNRLARAQHDNARAQIELLATQGKITAEQAANAKANIANDFRTASALREQAKIRAQIASTEKDLADARANGMTEAEDAATKELATLHELLSTLEQINAAEADKGNAEYQKTVAEIRERLEKSITAEKQEQQAATQGIAAAEAAITEAQANRSSRHRDNPFASSAHNAPVGADQPALQPTTDFQAALAPRAKPPTPASPSPAGPSPSSPAVASPSAAAITDAAASNESAVREIGEKAVQSLEKMGDAVISALSAMNTTVTQIAQRVTALERKTS